MSRPGAERGEDGVVLALVSLLMVSLLVMTAIVVDHGMTRVERRSGRSVADSAAAAGALDMTETSAVAACTAAAAYAFANLRVTSPGGFQAACTAAMPAVGTCTTTTAAQSVTFTSGSTAVTIVSPIPNGHPYLRATVIAGGKSQNVDAVVDGEACQRIGVSITQPQVRVFGGIVTDATSTFTVRSVALFDPGAGPRDPLPALVALNQHACKAIDSGSGSIFISPDTGATFPGTAISDSDGANCSGSDGILHSRTSGKLQAGQLNSSTPGILQWYQAPISPGYVVGSSWVLTASVGAPQNYVGSRTARSTRVTNLPATKKFKCRSVSTTVQPLCNSSKDAVTPAQALLGATSAPAGYATLNSCTLPPAIIASTFINCPGGVTVSSLVTFNPVASVVPRLIFNGPLTIAAGGRLMINTLTVTGDPVPLEATADPLIVVTGTLSMQSTSATVSMAQTTVVASGGLSIQGSPTLLWSPPVNSPSRNGLLFWTDSTTARVVLSGSPTLFALGVFYAGGLPTLVSGGGTIDVRRVQMWVDTVEVSGGGSILLRADPSTAARPGDGGTRLIR